MIFGTLPLTLLLFLATSVDVAIVNLPTRGRVNLTFSPSGKGDVERQGAVSRVRVEIDRMQTPGALAGGMNAYVVWAVSPEGEVENIGELEVDNRNRGRFEATTLFDQFAVLVTAEPHYMVDRPGAALIYRNDPPRNTGASRVQASVELGTYEYYDLPIAEPGVPKMVAQARAAIHIARAAEAGRWAEAEFRMAQAALGAAEELYARNAPADFVLPTAHESIRRAHRAFLMSRENIAANELLSARNDLEILQRDMQAVRASLAELESQRVAATEQIRTLESRLAESTRDREILIAEQEAAAIRLRRVEAELADVTRRQQDMENAIAFHVSDEFFDYERGALTAAGREALTKIASVLALWESPIRVGTTEEGAHIVRTFLAQSDAPMERVIIVVER